MNRQEEEKKSDKKGLIGDMKKGSRKKRILVLSLVLIVPVFCLLAIYIAGLGRYQSCFLSGTVIDEVDVSGMTIPELQEQIGKYSLRVIERQADGTVLEEEIKGKDIGISYISTEPLKTILQEQNHFLWFLGGEAVYETKAMPFYEEAVLEEKIGELRGFQKEFIEEPTDAYIADYVPGSGFELVAENRGNRLNREKTIEAVKAAVEGLEGQVDLDAAGCYDEPEVTLEDAGLKKTYEKLQKYANAVITYTFGAEQEVLDGDTIAGWITRSGNRVSLDRELVKEYVSALRKRHDTVFHKRKFLTSYGVEVTIDQGDYGWWMDTEQETDELIKALNRGESGERVPVYRQTAASYDDPDYGNSYVEINLTAQHLFLYQNGACVLESDFVSGNPSRGNATPAGIYGITYKERDATLKGETYRTPVSFWMPFNNNVGMHDATWRSEFGRNIYMTNGSHGCINLPYAVAQEIFNYVEKGSPVICYYLPGTEPEPLPEVPAELEPGMEAPEDGLTAPGAGQPSPEPSPQPEAVPQPEPSPQPEVIPQPETVPQPEESPQPEPVPEQPPEEQ